MTTENKTTKKVAHAAWKLLLVLAGNTLYALGVALFVLPTGLITGGTTGLGLVAQNYLRIPLPAFVAVFNVAMFLLGLAVLGKVFALTTVISSFYYPFILAVFQGAIGDTHLTDDPLLATILAGVMIGAGMGIVIRAGASTGGMDIPPLVLQKKLKIPVSLSLYAFDCCVLLLQALFSNVEQGALRPGTGAVVHPHLEQGPDAGHRPDAAEGGEQAVPGHQPGHPKADGPGHHPVPQPRGL